MSNYDITYIPMAKGFVYLVAVMDWFSRRVLSWRLSLGMETDFCVEALREAMERHGWQGPVPGQHLHRTLRANEDETPTPGHLDLRARKDHHAHAYAHPPDSHRVPPTVNAKFECPLVGPS